MSAGEINLVFRLRIMPVFGLNLNTPGQFLKTGDPDSRFMKFLFVTVHHLQGPQQLGSMFRATSLPIANWLL